MYIYIFKKYLSRFLQFLYYNFFPSKPQAKTKEFYYMKKKKIK